MLVGRLPRFNFIKPFNFSAFCKNSTSGIFLISDFRQNPVRLHSNFDSIIRYYEGRIEYDPTDPNAGSGDCFEPFNSGSRPSESQPDNAAPCRSNASLRSDGVPPASLHPVSPEFLSPSSVSGTRALFQCSVRAATLCYIVSGGDGAAGFQRAHGGIKAGASSSTPWLPGATAAAAFSGEGGARTAYYIYTR